MCCHAKLNLTNDFLKKNKDKKWLIVYKIMRVVDNSLCSPYYSGTKWKTGVFKTAITSSRIKYDTYISYGFHVWLSKKSAEEHLIQHRGRHPSKIFTIISMRVKIKNLLGVGRFDGGRAIDNAVFSEVSLHRREIERALQRSKRD